jgi:hypothetical protein
MPDWPWQLSADPQGILITLESPYGPVVLHVHTQGAPNPGNALVETTLHRAGQSIFGPPLTQPTWGWYAPTYDVREPALALGIALQGPLPLGFTTSWQMPAATHPARSTAP